MPSWWLLGCDSHGEGAGHTRGRRTPSREHAGWLGRHQSRCCAHKIVFISDTSCSGPHTSFQDEALAATAGSHSETTELHRGCRPAPLSRRENGMRLVSRWRDRARDGRITLAPSPARSPRPPGRLVAGIPARLPVDSGRPGPVASPLREHRFHCRRPGSGRSLPPAAPEPETGAGFGLGQGPSAWQPHHRRSTIRTADRPCG